LITLAQILFSIAISDDPLAPTTARLHAKMDQLQLWSPVYLSVRMSLLLSAAMALHLPRDLRANLRATERTIAETEEDSKVSLRHVSTIPDLLAKMVQQSASHPVLPSAPTHPLLSALTALLPPLVRKELLTLLKAARAAKDLKTRHLPVLTTPSLSAKMGPM
jgi:hypothetical protein